MRGTYAVLAPGAARDNKRWPAAYWVDLARLLARQGLQCVAVGLPSEASLLPPTAATPCYDRSVRVAAALCEGARVVVTNDSGVMHVASAVGANAIALFGPTAPALGFAPRGTASRVMERTLPCRPCSILGGTTCPERHHRCLGDISPVDVANEVVAAT
jgi:ADP-heptose:LPS heptosyltransferase